MGVLRTESGSAAHNDRDCGLLAVSTMAVRASMCVAMPRISVLACRGYVMPLALNPDKIAVQVVSLRFLNPDEIVVQVVSLHFLNLDK